MVVFVCKPSHLQNYERGGGAKKEAWGARFRTVLCIGSLDWHLEWVSLFS